MKVLEALDNNLFVIKFLLFASVLLSFISSTPFILLLLLVLYHAILFSEGTVITGMMTLGVLLPVASNCK